MPMPRGVQPRKIYLRLLSMIKEEWSLDELREILMMNDKGLRSFLSAALKEGVEVVTRRDGKYVRIPRDIMIKK